MVTEKTPDRFFVRWLDGYMRGFGMSFRQSDSEVEYIRADLHQTEVDALHAELDRLVGMIGEDATREGVQRKYDWAAINKKCPFVKYVATDRCGDVYAFEHKPIPDKDEKIWWTPRYPNAAAPRIGSLGYVAPDWMDSLEERPDMEDEK